MVAPNGVVLNSEFGHSRNPWRTFKSLLRMLFKFPLLCSVRDYSSEHKVVTWAFCAPVPSLVGRITFCSSPPVHDLTDVLRLQAMFWWSGSATLDRRRRPGLWPTRDLLRSHSLDLLHLDCLLRLLRLLLRPLLQLLMTPLRPRLQLTLLLDALSRIWKLYRLYKLSRP